MQARRRSSIVPLHKFAARSTQLSLALLTALGAASACVVDDTTPESDDTVPQPPGEPDGNARAEPANVVARDRPAFTVTAAAAGSGTGTITAAAAHIACGPICEGKVADGTTVELVADADAGVRFVGWLGGDCHGTGTCSVEVHRSQTITAVFAVDAFVAVVREGTGTGVVTADHGDLACGEICGAAYPADDVVTLTATPAPGDVFAGWSGEGCSGTGPCTLVLDDDLVEVTASFMTPEPL